MRLPRFRVRTLMVVVAVVALGLLLEVRRHRFAALAQYHNERAIVVGLEGNRLWEHARCRWHGEMGEKYESATRHPWLPVAADPPPPE